MFERVYRKRLEADLVRWEVEHVITPTTADAIRGELRKAEQETSITLALAIVGGLLIAASILAFVAANWTEINRPLRLGILLAGLAGAFVLGAWFERRERRSLADLSVAVGSIIFGAAIALIGQMYHLGEDFAAGMLLWTAGALVASALTSSRGALAVALVVGCIWNGTRAFETADLYLPFLGIWTIAACLAVIWNDFAARHMAAIAAVVGWLTWAIASQSLRTEPDGSLVFAFYAGIALLFGAGHALASRGPHPSRSFGLTLSDYGFVALAFGPAVGVIVEDPEWHLGRGLIGTGPPGWSIACAAAGLILAIAASAVRRSFASIAAVLAIALVLIAVSGWVQYLGLGRWPGYGLALVSTLCFLISGMLEDKRSYAGWIGFAAVTVAITWGVKASLLHRAAFLAISGIVALALASVFGRVFPRERPQ